MPRTLVRAAEHDRDRSIGWLALAWMEFFVVHGPGDVQGEQVRHGDEYSGFIADCYGLDPAGRMLYDSAFFSRPKGCDKSGMGGRFGLFEAFGPSRFNGFARGGEIYRDPWGMGFEYEFQPGEPLGRPVKVPFIRCMATEESQTGLVYDTIHFNLTEGPLQYTLASKQDAGLSRVLLPGGGEITPSTASSASKDGGKETWSCFDESHLYTHPELRQMYRTVARNLRKRKRIAGTWYLETTTMFAPGQESVAEETFRLAERIRAGKSKRDRLLYDHQWGDCEDPKDEAALRVALAEAYGDAMAWHDLDGLVDEFFDPRAMIQDSRRFFLNAETETSDAWLAAREWDSCADPVEIIADDEPVTLGFDGSISDDATALVMCRVSDGHLQIPEHAGELTLWERPEDAPEDWRVNGEAVSAAVAGIMGRFNVVGFYADPAHWRDYLAVWHERYSTRMQVSATQARPLEFWTNRDRVMVAALERFYEAVVRKTLSHDGGHQMRRHVLNARRRVGRSGMTISKEYPKSPNKIDACMAAVLAYEARADAVAAGAGSPPPKRSRRLHRF